MSRHRKKFGEDAQVDLTPMIDVVFQLIIFFVVTVNLDQQSLLESITLPTAKDSREEPRKDPRQITIQVDAKGSYYIGSSPLTLRVLQKTLKHAVRNAGTTEIPILIRGDMHSTHKYIRRVMDSCSSVGLYKIRFAALKRAAKQP